MERFGTRSNGDRLFAFFGQDSWLGLEAVQQSLQDDVQDRDKEEVEDGGEDHAADDCGTDRVAAVRTCSGGEVKRADTENEGDGGHQDGAEAEFGGDDSCELRLRPILMTSIAFILGVG